MSDIGGYGVGARCTLCGQIVYGLCAGVNSIPGVVCQNYTHMMQQRVYDWAVRESERARTLSEQGPSKAHNGENNPTERLRRGVDTNEPPDKTDRVMYDAAAEIERLRAALRAAGEAMLDWHLLSDEDRDGATNKALEGRK